nr:hypothetical protein Iba_chr02bCG21980 [Ipomoea batatas]
MDVMMVSIAQRSMHNGVQKELAGLIFRMLQCSIQLKRNLKIL